MPKEILYLRFIQTVVTINTFIFAIGVMAAKKGNIPLHKKLNGTAVALTVAGVLGLVFTVMLGWDYPSVTTPQRLLIHRCFSMPLFIGLMLAAYFGIKGNRKKHLFFVFLTVPFWIGTLTTGLLFF